MGIGAARQDPGLGDVLKAAIGLGGMTMCLTLVFLAMRAVMGVGGACADGGPYVSAQSCPDGSTAGLLLGIFGLFLFGGISMIYAGRLGGIWGAVPLLAWTGLFASLGWNFLDYGLFNPPPEADGVVWGWVICGVMFEVMAFAPLVAAIPAIRMARQGGEGSAVALRPALLRGPGMSRSARTMTPSPAGDPSPGTRPTTPAEQAVLRDIAADMGAVVIEATASTPADPLARAAATDDAAAFAEGTQALLDRLERLGDMRDRGLLSVEEFETAKAPIVAELEARG